MSLLKVGRNSFKPDWTLGRFYINNILDGFTVEDEIREVKVKGETAIPFGKYALSIRQSPKFSKSFLYSDSANILIEPKEKTSYSHIKDWRNHDLIWVTKVPNFDFILIHWGNTDDDTDGCLIVGSKIGVIGGQEGVLGSRVYYKKMYPKVYQVIKRGGQFIEYVKEK